MGNRSKTTKYKYLYGNNTVHIYDPKTDDSVCRMFERHVGNKNDYSISSSPPGKTLCSSCFETMSRLTKRTKGRGKPKEVKPQGKRAKKELDKEPTARA